MFISLNMLRKKAIYGTELLSKNGIENFVRMLHTEHNSAYLAKTSFQLYHQFCPSGVNLHRITLVFALLSKDTHVYRIYRGNELGKSVVQKKKKKIT